MSHEEQLKIVDTLSKDLRDCLPVKTEIDKYVSDMRDIYEGRLDTKTGVSNYISRDVFKQIEWAKAQYKNPFISNDTIVRLQPNAMSKRDQTVQTEKLVNHFYIKKFDRYNFMTDYLDALLIDGTTVIRTGWDYESETKIVQEEVKDPLTNQVIDIAETEVEVPIVNVPTSELYKIENCFIDPTATKNSEITFIGTKKEVSINELEKDGIYFNLDKINKDHNDLISQTATTSVFDLEFNRDNLISNFEDDKRKKLSMYEYWGTVELDGELHNIVACFIGTTLIRLDENPYPDGKIPFIINQCYRQPHTLYGKSMVDMLSDYQYVKTALYRGIFDNIALSNSTQIGIPKGMLSPKEEERYIDGKVFHFNGSNFTPYKGQYNRIPNEVFGMLDKIDTESNLTSGVVPAQGGQGSQGIYGSQAGKAGQLNSLALRELDMVINISDNLIKPMFRKWIGYMYEYMDRNQIEDITGVDYVDVEKDYSEHRNDFMIDISTQHTDEVKASELSFLLQTLGQSMPEELTRLIMSEIVRLKKMPDFAETIKQYQPEPDPFEQQMKQLELQKLQAEIQAIGSSIQSGQADANLKAAKAREAEAKAIDTNISAVRKKYGIDAKEQREVITAKANADRDNLITKAAYSG